LATRTISVAGGNWNATTTWDEGIVPVKGDAVVARGGGDSGNVTVNVPSACTTLILTNYHGILTFNATLTVSGTVTFVSTQGTMAGTSDLIVDTTATITSGGKTLPGGLQLQGTSQTFTIGDDWSITGVLNFNGVTGTALAGTHKLTVAGGLTVGVNVTTAATPSITMTGGAWTGTGILRINLELKGDVTLLNGTNYFDTKTLTYTSGNITITGNTIQCAAGTTFVGALALNNVTITANGNFTVPNGWTVNGTVTCTGGVQFQTNGASMVFGALTFTNTAGTFIFPGNLTISGALTIGCATLTLNGAATYTLQAASMAITIAATVAFAYAAFSITGSTTISANTSFNAGSGSPTLTTAGLTHGTYTVGGTMAITLSGGTWSGTGSFTSAVTLAGTITIASGTRICGSLAYSTGAITLTGVTLSLSGTVTLSTDPLVWENMTITAAATITINSLLSVSGTLTLPNAAVTFAGTAGFTVGTLAHTTVTAARTYTLADSRTYTVTAALALIGTVSYPISLFSNSVTGCNFVLGPGATQDVGFVNPKWLTSSAGQPIFTYKGTITTCVNWISAYPVGATINDAQLLIGL
jgi:hypothetical protein